MDAETKNKINAKIATLPVEIQKAISSIEIGNKVNSIAKKHGLLLDQTSDLYLEIMLAMIGLEPLADFVDNVRNNVGLDSEKAQLLATDVNNEVFLSVREGLMKLNVEDNETSIQDNPSKEDILSEIENPTPTVHPISIVDQTVPGPAKPLEIVATPTSKESVAKEFIAGKMTENVSLPSQKEKYSTDPYREPIA